MLPYLSLAIWVPILAGLAVLVVHRDDDASRARWIASLPVLIAVSAVDNHPMPSSMLR